MRKYFSERVEKGRLQLPGYPETKCGDKVGAFQIVSPKGMKLGIVIADGMGWEHVSVSTRTRIPTWEEMCFVKDLFWEAEECVVQYHPPKSDYVNCHDRCLHLWKPLDEDLPRPPSVMVGPQGG